MKEFEKAPLDSPAHPENEIIPKLVSQTKAAVFVVKRWLSINYAADYKKVLAMGHAKLARFPK